MTEYLSMVFRHFNRYFRISSHFNHSTVISKFPLVQHCVINGEFCTRPQASWSGPPLPQYSHNCQKPSGGNMSRRSARIPTPVCRPHSRSPTDNQRTPSSSSYSALSARYRVHLHRRTPQNQRTLIRPGCRPHSSYSRQPVLSSLSYRPRCILLRLPAGWCKERRYIWCRGVLPTGHGGLCLPLSDPSGSR